jgi:carboxylesterase
VVDGFERLRSFGDPVAVVGLSAGALLAARLAVDQGDEVAALAMLAPAMFLPLWTRAALRAVARFGEWTGRIYLQSGASDIHDTAAREVHPRTRLMPLSAPGSLMELSAMLRTRLAKLNQPTLIVHSRRDHICPLRPNLNYLMKHVGSADKRAVVLEESFHVITVDTEKERVAAEVIEFLMPLRVPAARALCG